MKGGRTSDGWLFKVIHTLHSCVGCVLEPVPVPAPSSRLTSSPNLCLCRAALIALTARVAMSLSRLADVEVQSICHFLRGVDILHMARCSKRLMTVALAPFAWRHAVLDLNTAAMLSTMDTDAGKRLLSLAPRVALRWKHHLGGATRLSECEFDPSALALCGSRARSVVELSVRDGTWITTAKLWEQALAPPSFRSVHTLRILLPGFVHDGEILQVVKTALPQLTALHIECASKGNSQYEELADFPLLTSLTLPDNEDSAYSCLAGVTRCAQLRQLHVVVPHLSAANCKAVFASKGFRGLEFLQLSEWTVSVAISAKQASAQANQFQIAFACLVSLRVLHLRSTANVSSLLPMLSRIPKLERLICEPGEARLLSSCPSLAALQSLLSAASRLTCELRVSNTAHLRAHVELLSEGLSSFGTRFIFRRDLTQVD